MQKFNFHLQTVLKVRRQTERRLKQEYFQLKLKLQIERQRVDALEAEVHKAAAEARERESLHFEVALERAYCDYLQMLEGRIRLGREAIRRMETDLHQRLQALIASRRDVRVLENLRQRKFVAYCKAGRRQEQKFFDEVAVLRSTHAGGA